MQRFKTRQEFVAEFGELKNWNEEMNPWFGLSYSGTLGAGKNPYPLISKGQWTVIEEHLTMKPHPYDGEAFIVEFKNDRESSRVQKKAFALGYKWRGASTEVAHTDKPFIHFSKGQYLTFSDDRAHSESQRLPIITAKEFMDADKLPKPRSHASTTPLGSLQTGDRIEFELPEHILSYVVERDDYGWYLNSAGTRSNNAIFKDLGLDKYRFIEALLGYSVDDDDFPYVRSLHDLGLVINELQSICMKRRASYSLLSGTSSFIGRPAYPDEIGFKVRGEDLAASLAKLTGEPSPIHKQPKTTKDGKTIKVQRTTPTIKRGERTEGRTISGRTSKASTRSRYLGYQTVPGRV